MTQPLTNLSDRDLAEAIEEACSAAAAAYDRGQDTAEEDARVDALFAEHGRRSQPCQQCGVRFSDHVAGDGITSCPGDFEATR